jgi:hypothetical protein
VSRNILLLLGITALAWIVLAIPAWRLWGTETLLFSGVAAAICSVAAIGSIGVTGLASARAADQRLYAMLAGSMGRTVLVLLIGLVLYLEVPPFAREDGFLYWLLIFYLLTLVTEKSLLLRYSTKLNGEGTAPSAT